MTSNRLPTGQPHESRVTFRPLRSDDPPRLLRWLRDPDVAPWYREGNLTLPAIEARFAVRIAGRDSTRAFIFAIDGLPAGYIQCYRIADEPDYARQLDLPPSPAPGPVGTDLFIGEPGWRNRGWGTAILRAFHRRIVFGEMRAGLAVIAPEPQNLRAIRAYERAGFRWLKTVPVVDDEHPENTGDEYVMTMTPGAFLTHNPL